MQETEIKNRLEALLDIEGVTIQVVDQGSSLLVMLNRSGADHLDYSPIVAQIVDEVELNLPPYQSIQFFSRELGEHDPDWERTVALGHQLSGNTTVIVSSARSAPTVIEYPPDEPSTKLVAPPTQIIEEVGSTATTIEEEEFNLPKPNLQPNKPKRSKPKPTPIPQDEAPLAVETEDHSAPTEIAIAAPKPKPKTEPVLEPVKAPFPLQTVVIAIVTVVAFGTIGWFAWSLMRPNSKPKPKKAEVVFAMPTKIHYNNNLQIKKLCLNL